MIKREILDNEFCCFFRSDAERAERGSKTLVLLNLVALLRRAMLDGGSASYSGRIKFGCPYFSTSSVFSFSKDKDALMGLEGSYNIGGCGGASFESRIKRIRGFRGLYRGLAKLRVLD